MHVLQTKAVVSMKQTFYLYTVFSTYSFGDNGIKILLHT